MTPDLVLVGPASPHTYRAFREALALCRRVYLVTDRPPPEDVASAAACVLAVRFGFRHLGTAARIRCLLDAVGPCPVHVQQAASPAFHARRAVAGTGCLTVVTAWGSELLVWPQRSPLRRALLRANLEAAAVVTADSADLGESARDLVRRPVDLRLVRFGVDDALFDEPSEPRDDAILSTRLHEPLYRLDAVIRAFAGLTSRPAGAGWRLVLAGSGSRTDELRALAASLGLADRVSFPGWLEGEALRREYRRARVFASVPSSDAGSVSVAEALAAGCIPVLSAVPANREWVEDGVTGFLWEPAEELAGRLEAAVALVSSPERCRAARVRNRDLVAATASRAAYRARFGEIYRELGAGPV